MLPAELIKRIRRLDITTRRVVSQVLSGQYKSAFKGQGMAFSEVREYQPGDEVRTIDWNVTARMNSPYVKVFEEERELLVMLLVDVSASESFGSHERSKAEVGAEIAAQIALSAIANNDRVGLVLFSDRIEKVVPARKGRSHVLRLVTDILAAHPKGRGTDLPSALSYLSRLARRRAVAFIVSDFLVDDYEKNLHLASRKHDVVPVVVTDPYEAQFPAVGLVDIEDPETLERVTIDTSSAAVRAHFRQAARRRKADRERIFRKLRLDWVDLNDHEDNAASLVRFFRAREHRLAMA